MFPSGVTCGTAGQPPCLYSHGAYIAARRNSKDSDARVQSNRAFLLFLRRQRRGARKTTMWSMTNGCLEPLPVTNAAIFEVTQTSPPQTVWQMQITGQYAYRGMRIPSLYPGVQW